MDRRTGKKRKKGNTKIYKCTFAFDHSLCVYMSCLYHILPEIKKTYQFSLESFTFGVFYALGVKEK